MGTGIHHHHLSLLPALRGDAVWETKLDQGDRDGAVDGGAVDSDDDNDVDDGAVDGHGHEVDDSDDDIIDKTEITLF